MEKNIVAITLGIRFSQSFRLQDISGEILDQILYLEDSPFYNKFELVFRNSPLEKIVRSANSPSYFRVNKNDIIFMLEVENNFDSLFASIKNDIQPFLERKIFSKYRIHNIERFGIVFHHLIKNNSGIENSVAWLTNNQVNDLDSISISFTKKIPLMESVGLKNISDYEQAICNIEDTKDGLFADLDYQHYYLPPRQDLYICEIDKVIDSANYYLKNKFQKWISAYEVEEKKVKNGPKK